MLEPKQSVYNGCVWNAFCVLAIGEKKLQLISQYSIHDLLLPIAILDCEFIPRSQTDDNDEEDSHWKSKGNHWNNEF